MALQIGVIGGSGFIGTWLVEALLRLGHRVTIIDLKPSERFPELAVRADVRDRAALLAACRGCTGGITTAPMLVTFNMFCRCPACSGVSRTISTSRRRSFSTTSAARDSSDEVTPVAISDSERIEHGATSIPRVWKLPLNPVRDVDRPRTLHWPTTLVG